LVSVLQQRAQGGADKLAYALLFDGEMEACSWTDLELENRARALAVWIGSRASRGERALVLLPLGASPAECADADSIAAPVSAREGDRGLLCRLGIVPDNSVVPGGQEPAEPAPARMDVSEIEARLVRHDAVQALVLVRDPVGDGKPVAYAIAGSDLPLSPESLRAFLAASSSEYTAVAALRVPASVPLTSEGKVEHGASRASDGLAAIARDGTPNDLSKLALGDVFIAHRAQLWSIAQKIVGTADLAGDVVQEAYLKVAHASCTRDVEKPFAYCCQVVRNVAFDFRRRHAVESSYRTYTDDGEPPQVPDGTSPEQVLDERRVLDAIDKALQAVPARTRRAFELHCLGGLTQREIGQRLGCSATLINFMVRDARDALAACRALRE
jgi:RNA polymerase sigma-70 factor (ECF subfamily)